MIDWIKRGIFGRDLSKVSIPLVSVSSTRDRHRINSPPHLVSEVSRLLVP